MSMKFNSVNEETVVTGNNVLLFPFATIGFTGFGFDKNKDGKYKIPLKRRPHKFKVIIKDDVTIGACTSVDKGSWRHTIIEKGTQIDSNCKIAHNVHVGKNTWIAAGSVLCGSCEVGDECQIGAGTIIKPHIKVGNKVITGSGAVIVKDVPDGVTVAGNPAKILDKGFITVP